MTQKEWVKLYGHIFRIWRMMSPSVVISSPEFIEVLYNNDTYNVFILIFLKIYMLNRKLLLGRNMLRKEAPTSLPFLGWVMVFSYPKVNCVLIDNDDLE